MQFISLVSLLSIALSAPLTQIVCIWTPTTCTGPCSPGFACKVTPATPFSCQEAVCTPVAFCSEMIPMCKMMCIDGMECVVQAARSVFECPRALCLPSLDQVEYPISDDEEKVLKRPSCPSFPLTCQSCGPEAIEGKNCKIVPQSGNRCGYVQCHL